MIPYSYLIGWTNHNKYYYGIRYAKNCHPDDLWKKYFTSSKKVKEFRKKFGEPDIIQIRRTFSNKEDCIAWEIKLLRRINVLEDDKWLNANIAGMLAVEQSNAERVKNGSHNFLKGHPCREKIDKDNKLRAINGEHWSAKNRDVWGKIMSKHQQKLGAEGKMWTQSTKGRDFCRKRQQLLLDNGNHHFKDPVFIEKNSNRLKERHNRLLAEGTHILQKSHTCPHCGKVGNSPSMFRWHFDNCKLKSNGHT